MAFANWSTTNSANTSVGTISIAEGCPPGNLNDAVREVMSELRTAINPVLDPVLSSADLVSARLQLGAAATGANADITDLTGLTLPFTRTVLLRQVQPSPSAGNGNLNLILQATLSLPKAAQVDLSVSYNHAYSGAAIGTLSSLRIDGNAVYGVGTGAAFQPNVGYADTIAMAAGDHVISFLWQGANSTVTLTDGRVIARAFY